MRFDSVTVTGKLDQSWTQRKGKKEADTSKHVIAFHSSENLFQNEGLIAQAIQSLKKLADSDDYYVYKPDIFMLVEDKNWIDLVSAGLSPILWLAKRDLSSKNDWKLYETWKEFKNFRDSSTSSTWGDISLILECY